MSYRYSLEDLLALLHSRALTKVDAVALHLDASSMAFCQWALKFTALAMEASSQPW